MMRLFEQPVAAIGVAMDFGATLKSVGLVGSQASETLAALPYVGEKLGGSDVGQMVSMDDQDYIVKIGVTLSLLGQALKKYIEGDTKRERTYLGYIVGNFTRIAGNKYEDHPHLTLKSPDKIKSLTDVLTDELLETLNQFKETEEGRGLLEKLKHTSLNVREIYLVYHYLVTQNPVLQQVMGLAAFADVVNGVCGQFFNNTYQKRVINSSMLDDIHLLIEKTDVSVLYMASRFNHDAQPFDAFLLKPFLDNKLTDFADKDTWLAKCQEDLLARITDLQGLNSAILIRHMMGEGGDLGPDNMLVLDRGGKQYVINIDVTGFRYPRRMPFYDKYQSENRLGWEETLKTYDQAELLNRLFDGTVFCSRFVNNEKSFSVELKREVMKVIVSVLRQKAQATVENEVADVREWLQSQTETSIDALKNAMKKVYGELNPLVQFQADYLNKLICHNEKFIHDSIEVAKSLPANAPRSRPGLG